MTSIDKVKEVIRRREEQRRLFPHKDMEPDLDLLIEAFQKMREVAIAQVAEDVGEDLAKKVVEECFEEAMAGVGL